MEDSRQILYSKYSISEISNQNSKGIYSEIHLISLSECDFKT